MLSEIREVHWRKLQTREEKSMVMKFRGNVRGDVRVNFLANFGSKPHILMCGAVELSAIVCANVHLNIAIPMLFLSLTKGPNGDRDPKFTVPQKGVSKGG